MKRTPFVTVLISVAALVIFSMAMVGTPAAFSATEATDSTATTAKPDAKDAASQTYSVLVMSEEDAEAHGEKAFQKLPSGYYMCDGYRIPNSDYYVYCIGIHPDDLKAFQEYFQEPLHEGSLCGLWIDAEKQGGRDFWMCWAGATSNSLWFSGWAKPDEGQKRRFFSEDDVLDVFRDYFRTSGGETFYSARWFVDGDYTLPGMTYLTRKDGGAYRPDVTGITANDNMLATEYQRDGKLWQVQYSMYGVEDYQKIWDLMKQQYAVSTAILGTDYSHAISLWGIVTKGPMEKAKAIAALLNTDPDDDRHVGRRAPNRLLISLTTEKNHRQYYNQYGFSEPGTTFVMTAIALVNDGGQPKNTTDLSSKDGGKFDFTKYEANEGNLVYASDIKVINPENGRATPFTVEFFARNDVDHADTYLGTYTSEHDLQPGETFVINDFPLDLSNVPVGEFSIGWKLSGTFDPNFINNERWCRDLLEIWDRSKPVEQASTIVTTLEDVTCPTDGKTSLREAIQHAGNDGLGTTVTFADELAGQTLTLFTTLAIEKTLTIQAPEGGVTIDAERRCRIFRISGTKEAPISVELKGLTLVNGGRLSDMLDAQGGGLIASDCTLKAEDCTITKCSATAVGPQFATGGGVECLDANVTLLRCTISQNYVFSTDDYVAGAGVHLLGGSLEMTDCKVEQNQAVSIATHGSKVHPKAYALGGGVSNEGGKLTLKNCTITGNSVKAPEGTNNANLDTRGPKARTTQSGTVIGR